MKKKKNQVKVRLLIKTKRRNISRMLRDDERWSFFKLQDEKRENRIEMYNQLNSEELSSRVSLPKGRSESSSPPFPRYLLPSLLGFQINQILPELTYIINHIISTPETSSLLYITLLP
jgi:hypothetical protein